MITRNPRSEAGARGPTDPLPQVRSTPTPSAEQIEAIRAVARLARRLERAADDLNLGQYRVLSAVASGDNQASRLADKLAMGKPTISATVDALCRRGLLDKSPVDTDQRAVHLSVTATGQRMLDAVERAMVDRLVTPCGAVDDPEAVIHALVQIGRALESTVGHGPR